MITALVVIGIVLLWETFALVTWIWQRKNEWRMCPWLEWAIPRPVLWVEEIAREVLEDRPDIFGVTVPKSIGIGTRLDARGRDMTIVCEEYDRLVYYMAPTGWKAKVCRSVYVLLDWFWTALRWTVKPFNWVRNQAVALRIAWWEFLERRQYRNN